MDTPESRYVGFVDILGFSDAIEERFDETIEVYRAFMELHRSLPGVGGAQVTVYSDAMLAVGKDLEDVVEAVRNLSFAALAHDFLVRGGIAYGRYWEAKNGRDLFIASDAPVRAVKVEKTVSHPGVGFSSEVEIPLGAWISVFKAGLINAPMLHFRGLTIVNPFNPYWFRSAKNRVEQLLVAFPEHSAKYTWFLDLWEAVDRNDLLLPPGVLQELIALGVIEKRSSQ